MGGDVLCIIVGVVVVACIYDVIGIVMAIVDDILCMLFCTIIIVVVMTVSVNNTPISIPIPIVIVIVIVIDNGLN